MTVTLHHGDCLDVLRTLPYNSVDSIVTDPPYGISFMGARWDRGVPSAVVWEECLRVLKPGGHLLSFASTRTQHRMATNIEDAGFEIRDLVAWVYGSGMPKSHNLRGEHEGWGTTLKPALEPITVARKPLVGSVKLNVQVYGTGALNIAACRVHASDAQGGTYTTQRLAPGNQIDATGNWHQEEVYTGTLPAGRWPANLIHDGSPEVLALFPANAGASAPVKGTEPSEKTKNAYGRYGNQKGAFHADEGSAARFFYCAKAARSDRNEGIGGSDTPAVQQHATMRVREQADWAGRNGNHHPTVKPTELMRYLVRLVTPLGGLVLDPFMGSGSTGKAATLEGMSFTGIDLSAEYVEIARQRIAHAVETYRREQPLLLGVGD